MKFLTNIDLSQNELQNFSLQKLGTAPTTPVKGQMYYNSGSDKPFIYVGNTWVDFSNTHAQNTDVGTSSSTFYVGTNGVLLKNSSGNLLIRNSADNAYMNITAKDATIEGVLTVKGNSVIGDSASSDTLTINAKAKVSSPVTKASGNKDINVFEVLDSAGAGLFEVKQNGDAKIGGALTVSSGSTSFTGSTSVEDLSITGNLTVGGNTILGDNASVDTTRINGVTTIVSKATKALGSATNNVFQVHDSSGTGLFEVKENGDTVIAGVLTVNGTGTSKFAGNVEIGGALTVAEGATVRADMSADNMTIKGNLVVEGNTTLGNDSTDKLDVVGVVTLPTTTTVGTVTYTNLNDSVTKRHSQNTDVGTSSSTFYVGTGGVKLKNSSGELQVRNNADTGYASIRVGDLYVEGTQTVINANTVSIGDNQILLNSDVTAKAQNSNGGISIKRLNTASAERNAELNFNNSTGRWETVSGDVEATLITAQLANKATALIGNGSATSIVVTHNFNTRDLSVTIRENSGSYAMVMADVEFTSVNTITIKFATAPASNAYSVTIVG